MHAARAHAPTTTVLCLSGRSRLRRRLDALRKYLYCTADHSLNGLLWFNRAEVLTFAAGPPNEFARSPSAQSLSGRNERVNASAATEHTNLNGDGRANSARTMCSLALNAFRTPHSLLALIIIIDRWAAEFNTVLYGRVHQLSNQGIDRSTSSGRLIGGAMRRDHLVIARGLTGLR